MGRVYEKEGGKPPEKLPGGLQEAPKRPRDDVTVRVPDMHPAKREESTSGSDVLSGSVFRGCWHEVGPVCPMFA
eukprot:4226634-Pyramimonas_sp.AAC.1